MMLNDRKVYAFSALFLATLGIAISMLGEHVGRAFLYEKVGPVVTLCGAALWIYARLLRRKR
jgi:hypothetical protein